MPLAALHRHGTPYVWCGTSPGACSACQNKCANDTTLRMAHKYGMGGDDPDHYHNDPMKPSVTAMLGCVRKAALMATVDYAESPVDLWPRAYGKARHVIFEGLPGGGRVEVEVSALIPGGGLLMGTIDYVGPGESYIADYKTGQSVRKTTDYRHAQQLSCYWDMLDNGKTPDLRIVSVAHAGSDDLPVEYDPDALPLAVSRAADYMAVLRGERDMSSLPSAGRNIKEAYGRKIACDYCPHAIKERCNEIGPNE